VAIKIKNNMKKLKVFLAVITLAIMPEITLATDSTGFSSWTGFGDGFNDEVYAVTSYNGSIVAAGKFTFSGSNSINYVAVWDGSQWQPLGSGMNEKVNALAVYNGDLIAGGLFTNAGGSSINRVAMWDGTEWQSLGNGIGSQADHEVNTLIVYNGELYAGGDFSNSLNNIAKWNGTAWISVGGGADDQIHSFTIYEDKLIAGGRFDQAGSINASKVAAWDGTSWSALGASFNERVFAVGVYNNQLIAGGRFTGFISSYNGSSWQTLGGGVEDRVYAITQFNDDLIIGGQFKFVGSNNQLYSNRIAKWNGTEWSNLGSGMDSKVSALHVSDSSLIAGGEFIRAGGKFIKRIAMFGNVETNTISGKVGYLDSNNVFKTISDGYVLALTIDYNTREAMVIDSVEIRNGGNYVVNVPVDTIYILAMPDSLNKFVPTYYPNTIDWEDATRLYPVTSLTGIDVTVTRLDSSGNDFINGFISGKAILNYLPPGLINSSGLPFKSRSIVYAIQNGIIKGFAVSNSLENYNVNDLPGGEYTVYVNRLGYTSSTLNASLNPGNNYTVSDLDFTLNPLDPTVGIKQISSEVIAEDFKLEQNFPNPFNPETNIVFSLKNNSVVTLKVYNLIGQEVATLVNEFKQSGTYQVNFNADGLSSGTYFYNLQSGDFSQTKKMTLIK
jgi:hypothetical protein